MIAVGILLAVVLAVRFRTFRIAAAVLLLVAFWKAALGLLVVAVVLRGAWHGLRAVRAANEARRAREDELRARCDIEDRLYLLGDPRGVYGLPGGGRA